MEEQLSSGRSPSPWRRASRKLLTASTAVALFAAVALVVQLGTTAPAHATQADCDYAEDLEARIAVIDARILDLQTQIRLWNEDIGDLRAAVEVLENASDDIPRPPTPADQDQIDAFQVEIDALNATIADIITNKLEPAEDEIYDKTLTRNTLDIWLTNAREGCAEGDNPPGGHDNGDDCPPGYEVP